MNNRISKVEDANSHLSVSGAIGHLIEHIRQNIESCIPGQFIRYEPISTNGKSDKGAYNRSRSLAIVSPLVKYPYVSGNQTVWTERPELQLRVLRVKSGGFWFEMPLKKGDTGWIIASDRDSSYAIERNSSTDTSKNAGQQTYSNFNKLKYAFGFFIPDGFCNLNVKEGHEGSSFWTKLKDDGSGERDSFIELKENGDIVLHGSGKLQRVLIEGNLGVTKEVEISGTISAEVENDDPVKVRDTETLIPMGNDMYSIWSGKVFRTEGKLGKPFRFIGGEGKLIEQVTYITTAAGTLITFIYTDNTQDTFLAPRGPQGEPGTGGSTTVTQGGGISVTGDPSTGYTITNALVLNQGSNVSITGNAATGYTISFTGSSGQTYTAGSGISISNQNVISAHWV